MEPDYRELRDRLNALEADYTALKRSNRLLSSNFAVRALAAWGYVWAVHLVLALVYVVCALAALMLYSG